MTDEQEFAELTGLRFDDVPDRRHRDRLERELLGKLAREKRTMGTIGNVFGGMAANRRRAVAAAVLAACVLLGCGWGAAEVARKMIGEQNYVVSVPPIKEHLLTLPDGRKVTMTLSGMAAGDYQSQEDADEQFAQMKQALAARRFELVKTFLPLDGGPLQYVYKFHLPGGKEEGMNFSLPLDDVKSYEEYEQRAADQREQRMGAINQAIAKGNYRLVDVDPLQTHICRDPQTHKVYEVMRARTPPNVEGTGGNSGPGRDDALVFPGKVGDTPYLKTSWREHLDAIASGQRELLDMQVVNSYRYRITLDDGTTTYYGYGGNGPLEKIAKPAKP